MTLCQQSVNLLTLNTLCIAGGQFLVKKPLLINCMARVTGVCHPVPFCKEL